MVVWLRGFRFSGVGKCIVLVVFTMVFMNRNVYRFGVEAMFSRFGRICIGGELQPPVSETLL